MRDPAVGDTLDGYEVQALLARGGMATLFKAVDRETGSTVVLKVPHIQYESDVVFHERFCREEEAARRVDHPNIVRALAPRGEKSRMYMVLEYVDGIPLSTMLHDRRPLPTRQAIGIARQTCDALAYLHALGIHHRDVKPGNVLVTRDGQVKLLDFGIAHITGARRLTIAGLSSSFGTPEYMAPEQMHGRSGDGRVDVYALGTMLFQMLTGRLPYAGRDWGELLQAKRLRYPTTPSTYVHDLDPKLEAIIMHAIEPRPADRYATAVDLLADLRNPAAAQVTWAAESTSRRRRNLRPLAAIASVVAAVGVIGWIGWLSHHRGLETAAASAALRTGTVARRAPPPTPTTSKPDG